MPDETFGDRLKRLRKARGLRVMDVAYAAGLTEGAIRQMEGGQTKGVTPDYLATGTEGGADDAGLTCVVLARLDDHERRIAALDRRCGMGIH